MSRRWGAAVSWCWQDQTNHSAVTSLMSVHRPSIVFAHHCLFEWVSFNFEANTFNSKDQRGVHNFCVPGSLRCGMVKIYQNCGWKSSNDSPMQGKTQSSAFLWIKSNFSQNLRRTLDLQGPQVLDTKMLRMKKNNKTWDGYQHAATSKQCWTLWSECPEQRSGRYVIDVIAQGKSTCTKAEANQNSLHGDQIQNLQIGEDSGSHASCCLFPLLYSFAWECLDHNRKTLKACCKVCTNTCEQTLSQTTTRPDTAKGLAPPAGLGQTATPWFICEFDEQAGCANLLWY